MGKLWNKDTRPINERFNESYKINQSTGCWEWIKTLHESGYGQLTYNGESTKAHIVSWELNVGPRNGLCVCHTCDNRICVNPEHLFLGTKAENTYDRNAKGRTAVGEKASSTKLTTAEVIEIRKLWEAGITINQLADNYKVTYTTIYNILNRKTWRHI